MSVDASIRAAMRDELRQVLAEEREVLVKAVVAEVRKLQTVDLLTTAEAAELARVEPKTVRRWVDAGKLSKHFAGGELRIVRAELLASLGYAPGLPEKPATDRLTDAEVEAKVLQMTRERK